MEYRGHSPVVVVFFILYFFAAVDKLLAGVLGGCTLVNLPLFEELHTKLQYPDKMVDPRGSLARTSNGWFYESRILNWMRHLNSPLEDFRLEVLQFAPYRARRQQRLEWLKKWEKDARREGLYAIKD